MPDADASSPSVHRAHPSVCGVGGHNQFSPECPEPVCQAPIRTSFNLPKEPPPPKTDCAEQAAYCINAGLQSKRAHPMTESWSASSFFMRLLPGYARLCGRATHPSSEFGGGVCCTVGPPRIYPDYTILYCERKITTLCVHCCTDHPVHTHAVHCNRRSKHTDKQEADPLDVYVRCALLLVVPYCS